MSKTTQVMSLSVPPSLIEALDDAALKRYGVAGKRSALACVLFEDFMSLDEKAHESLRRAAEHRGVSVSELVEFLVDRFSIEDMNVKPIVLKIPVTVIQDKELLKSWLMQKTNVLVSHLHPGE